MATEITINDLSGAQEPYTTYNELVMLLRALAYGVVDKDLTAPPGGETDETLYIPAATATGAWVGLENDLVWIKDTAWYYYTPLEGTTVRVRDEDKVYRFDGSAWASVAEFTTATIGDVAGGDYCQIEADGTIELNGDATVHEDLNFGVLSSGGPVPSRPDDVLIGNVYYKEFTSSNNQECSDQREIYHAALLGQTLYGHIHIFLKSGESAGTTGVTFTVYWEYRESTGATNGSFTLSATSAELTAEPYKIDIYDGTGFTGPSELGAQLSCRLLRTAGDAGDVIVTTYGFHVELDGLGSRTATSK